MQHVLLLFWLKWKLMQRGYRRNTTAVFGVIIALLVFLPLSILIAVVLGMVWRSAPEYGTNILTAALLGIYVLWLGAPLLGYSLNDSYDITRLFIYPLTVRQIFSGAVLGSLVDFPVLFMMPTLIAVLVSFGSASASALMIAIAAMALFLFQTLSLSQAVILGTSGVLRSRRYREIATLAVTFLWIAYYVTWQTAMRRTHSFDWRAVMQSPAWGAADWLPPGMAARAVSSAAHGSYAIAVAFLAVLALCTIATIYLASWLIERVYVGDEVGIRPRVTRQRAALHVPVAVREAREVGEEALAQRVPVVWAMFEKELRYLVRDPYYKVVLMNFVYIFFVSLFAMFNNVQHIGSDVERLALAWGATALLLMMQTQIVCNIFGTEGAGAATLFLTPAPRRDILMGKNLSAVLGLSVVNLLYAAATSGAAGVLAAFPLLFCWLELALVAFIAVGNVASVYFPYRLVMRGWRIRQQSASRGCGYFFIYVGVMCAAGVILCPVLAALAVPFFLAPAWLGLGIPLALLYAAGMYLLSLKLAAPMLAERETQILARVTAEE